ncbi:cell division topological specificity factor MinE [Roseivivax sp. CAU 1761]
MFGFTLRPRRPRSAQTAKERLQILLAHERGDDGPSADFLPMLQRDILEAIRRHVKVDNDAVDIRMEQADDISSLEINIELPTRAKAQA